MNMQTTVAKLSRALVLASLVLALPTAALIGAPAVAQASAGASLGSLAPFQTIVADTLALVNKGDLQAARTRIKDLETAWDKAEATLKPKNKASWTKIDTAIDEALTSLRRPNPQGADAAAALGKLDTILKKYSA
jgi:hypothetical protein